MISKIVRNAILVLGLFFAGTVFAINLVDLVETNPEFVPQGWKSIVAVCVAIYCGIMLSSEETDR